ncbi:uncharacterized protein RHOBADRAFT_66069 [Rhodotorula graminis WP1]|uniref:Zn(2)-C6 fungal-type domain-containing protein n=1 Tax=Rhodotorula graminis (strain WP1) TaxID=578459 RepID=A0A194SBC6_RHOGW|nr:uncharacterized protein RHOBADRAFT_66069 [Rhodotorula graminis WP1]KPV76711.1 hypothetical protein RHOBADRAFT_66069 [Rhodotorula graminis WP1]
MLPEDPVSPLLPPPKIVQKADRSCKKCRERRVRCGREFPTCARCKKRRDTCSFGEGVYVEDTVEGSDQQRIADLEGKITTLQSQLRSAATTSTSAPAPRPVLAPTSSSSNASVVRPSLAADISRALTDLLPAGTSSVLSAFLAEEGHSGGITPTFGNVDFRLAGTGLAHAVTCHLLDSATRACDSKLPGLATISSHVPLLKANLHDLAPHDQVNVATLCALGARTSPHSAFYGIASITSPEGTPVPALFSQVGNRRESLCKSLEKRALETAWSAGLFKTPSYEAAEAVAALAVLSIYEENDLDETRWLVRQAAGLFLDVRHNEMLNGTSSSLGKNVGLAVFMVDAQLAVQGGRPTVISPLELQDYWATSGLTIPDLVNAHLPELVDAKLRSTLSFADIESLVETILFHVYACYRVFAQVTSPARRSSSNSVLSFVRNLWNLVDQIHNAIQRLQQQLVAITDPLVGSDGDPRAVDHAILLVVRADDVLVHLVGYIHAYLMRDRDSGKYGPEREGDRELARARGESQMRVFKCLKLFAFYCQLYCSSENKHNVFHLLMQLEPLLHWTELVALRIGQPGGPLSDEFEVSEEEVEWFRMALELSLFYSPRLALTLQALVSARQKCMHKASPAMFPVQAAPVFAPPAPPPSNLSMPHASLHDPSLTSPAAANDNVRYPYSPANTPFNVGGPVSALQHGGPTHLPSTSSSSSTPHPFSFSQHPPTHMSSSSSSSMPQAGPMMVGQEGFANGAADDLSGSTTPADVRSAFQSVDWADLSLTPAPATAASDGSAGSTEGWAQVGGGGGARPRSSG